MLFRVQVLPTLEAAEAWLVNAVAARQSTPTQRVNILTGSNLQRLYYRRLLARRLGPSANVHFFTPVDLAAAIRQAAMGTPGLIPRQPLPDGGELLLLDEVLQRLHASGEVQALHADVDGVAEAVASALKDLREGAIVPDEFSGVTRDAADPKLRDLASVYQTFDHALTPLQDRTSIYEDALSAPVPAEAVQSALGTAPLLVVGIYDAPAVQLLLLRRCVDAGLDLQMALIAPPDPAFAFARTFRDALAGMGAEVADAGSAAGQPDAAGEHAYFSAPTRRAEAEEVTRRILALARDRGIRFQRMAVLHRLGDEADTLIAATLARAEIPVYRAAGRPLRHTAAGQAALTLLDLLLKTPERPQLLELAGNAALPEQILPGIRPAPALWERISKHAGLVRGWERFLRQLETHAVRLREDDRQPFEIQATQQFHSVVAELARAAREVQQAQTWAAYCEWLAAVLDAYVPADGDETGAAMAVRQRIEGLRRLDVAGISVDPQRFHAAAQRSLRRGVLTDSGALSRGVFVGSAAAARWLRFDAVFVVECAERIFPGLIRPDPLLPDDARAWINERLEREALALKRKRVQEEQMLFRLLEQGAAQIFTVSWARRANTTGAPKLPSSFLMQSIQDPIDELASVEDLYEQGVIPKLPAQLAGAAPGPTAVAQGDWSRTAEALDRSDFRLAVLEAAPRAARGVLEVLWPAHARYATARQGRNAETFTEWDGVLGPDALGPDPLAGTLAPTTLETYATCPYRYFLRHVVGVRAVSEPGEALEMSPLDRGSMVHAILERWVRAATTEGADWAAFLADEARLMAIADEEFARAAHGSLAGLPAAWSVVRSEVRADLRQLLARERERAAQGYHPIEAEWDFPAFSLTLPNGPTLRFQGRIDRIDEGPEGYVAIDYKTGRASRAAGAYVSGAALQLPVYLQAVARRFDVRPEAVQAAYWYVTRRGEFSWSGLSGEQVLTDTRFWDALRAITQGIRDGLYFPYPGDARGSRRRPNCTYCDYASVCTTDVDQRFARKARLNQEPVRAFLQLQAQQ